MPTKRIVGSSYQLSSTSYLTISNASNMYNTVDNTTYATINHTRSQTTAYYVYLRGFDFSQIPDNATVTSAIIKVKARVTSASTSQKPALYNDTTSLSASLGTAIGSSDTTSQLDITSRWGTYKGYGGNFGVRFSLNRSSKSTASNLRIYGAEIAVTYEEKTTQTCTIRYNNVTVATTEEEDDVDIVYDGSTIASAVSGTKTLKCSGKLMTSDVVVGSKTLKCNGKLMASDVTVSVT